MIELLLRRLSRSERIHQIVLATSTDPRNAPLVACVEQLGYTVFQGSESDVLDRYYQCARQAHADVVVRITADCPLIDPEVVDEVITTFAGNDVDYVSNIDPRTYPDGLDTEVFSFDALGRAQREATGARYREHVTSYIRESDHFSKFNCRFEHDYSEERWTVDEPEDFLFVQKIYEYFQPRPDFSWLEVIDLQERRPDLCKDKEIPGRREAPKLGTGQKLWKRAKRLIPGGNMLLSKRSEMFLPQQWPAYFSRARDCRVWDLDGREYIDMSLMGVGTNILGYGNRDVDASVRSVVDSGNMSTLNCAEEVYLAERLVELHPWADMVRLVRSGGEANAVAIRIARTASGRPNVAVCGYHGWHDWYLAANLGDDSKLAGHLLPGLQPDGVPPSLCGTVFPFEYNRFDELEAVVSAHDVGVIKMEVSRNRRPDPGFLESVRRLATDRNIVLVFDECTSGFRQSFGGLHRIYGVEPDMAVFGKALGNGYAIAAAIGRREVMEAAQGSFISSTFWTERIGPAAALKTLEVMEHLRSWETITATGKEISRRWQELSTKHGLSITTSGLPALASFSFDGPRHLAYKTLITQEMLRKGYLAGTAVYVCTEHTEEIVEAFFHALDPVFGLIKECEDGRDVFALLDNGVCHGSFKRLN